jgi:hypothetical protein
MLYRSNTELVGRMGMGNIIPFEGPSFVENLGSPEIFAATAASSMSKMAWSLLRGIALFLQMAGRCVLAMFSNIAITSNQENLLENFAAIASQVIMVGMAQETLLEILREQGKVTHYEVTLKSKDSKPVNMRIPSMCG